MRVLAEGELPPYLQESFEKIRKQASLFPEALLPEQRGPKGPPTTFDGEEVFLPSPSEQLLLPIIGSVH
jgi:hypothetical protein